MITHLPTNVPPAPPAGSAPSATAAPTNPPVRPTGTSSGNPPTNPTRTPVLNQSNGNGDLTRSFAKNRWILIVLSLIINIGLATWAWVLIKNRTSIAGNDNWNWGAVILALQVLHLCASIKIINPEELAAVVLLGRPLYSVLSGPRYVPFIICRLIRMTRRTVQRQFPGDPEMIDKSGDDKNPQPGKVQPIRITTASRDTVDPQLLTDEITEILKMPDPLNDRLTVEVSAIVRYRIRGIKGLILFIINIGSTNEADRQMRDVIERVLRVEFGRRTPSLIIMQRSQIDELLKQEVKVLVRDEPDADPDENWGIDILDVQVMDVDLSKTVNVGLAETVEQTTKNQRTVSQANAKAQALRATGDARKDYLKAEGAGKAQAREDILTAEAIGAEEMVNRVGDSDTGRLLMQMQVFREALQDANYSIVPSDLQGLAAGIQETLTKTRKKGTTP